MLHRIPIKPLSVNGAYRGRRFASPGLKQYKKDVASLLPKIEVPAGKLSVSYTFGVSSKMSDLDNCVKAFQDSLSESYNFNDKLIYEIKMGKTDVPKGSEYIEFEIKGL